MPFPSALSSPNLVKLRGDASHNARYYAGSYVSLCPNATVFESQVTDVPTGASFAQITFGSTISGAPANCLQDMTVLMGVSSDIRQATFIGRIRVTFSAGTILYINETSAPIAVGWYVWVINDYRLFDKLALIAGGTTQFKDWNIPFRSLLPYVRGLQSAYCGWITNPADTATKFRVAFSITAVAAASGASISTYSWVLPGTATVVSGSISSAAVTVDFASSTGDWVNLTVTDSNGNSITRHVFIHAASDTYPPLLGAGNIQIRGDVATGFDATMDAWAGLTSVLDNTLAVVWDQEYYQDTEGAILSVVKFVGRFRQQAPETRSDLTFSWLQVVKYQLEGFGAQMTRIESLPRVLTPKASPSVWDEIANLTVWRAVTFLLSEHSTFLNLCDIDFSSTDNTYLIPPVSIQKGSLLQAVNDLGVSINAAMEFAPQGESRVVTDARYLTSSQRNSLTTVADFTSQDWINLVIEEDPLTEAGKVMASGGYYNSSNGFETPLLSLAPGTAQNIGPNEIQLTRQYLSADIGVSAAQTELNVRAGNRLEIDVTRIKLRVRLPAGYGFLVPSMYEWYTWTIASTDNALGLSYTTSTRWLLQSIQVSLDNGLGSKQVDAVFTIETSGSAGQTVAYPSNLQVAPLLPIIPPDPYLNLFPEDPSNYLPTTGTNQDVPPSLISPPKLLAAPKDGNVVVAWDHSAAVAYITSKFLLSANPPWQSITPSGASGTWSKTFDFTSSNGGFTASPQSDGFTPDAPGTYVAATGWQTQVRTNSGTGTTSTECDIYINFGRIARVTQVVMTFSTTLGTFNAGTINDIIQLMLAGTSAANVAVDASTQSGAGLTLTLTCNNDGDCLYLAVKCSYYTGVHVDGLGTITKVVINGSGTNPFGSSSTIAHINQVVFDPFPGTGGKLAAYMLADDNIYSFVLRTEDVLANAPIFSQGANLTGLYATLRLTKTKGTIMVESPSVSGTAYVAVSTDYGNTWGTPVSVGASPGSSNGFDTQTQYGGTVSLSSKSGGQVVKATTIGGAYSNEGAALADIVYVIISWYVWGSDSSPASGGSPNFLIGLSALSGGTSLLRDDGTGTRTDITPSVGGTKALFTSPNFATGWKGKRWAVVGNISGTPHIFTTTDISAAGGGWSDRGSFTGCTYILIRRRAAFSGQLYANYTGGIIKYFPSAFSVGTAISKTTPMSTVDGMDIWA